MTREQDFSIYQLAVKHNCKPIRREGILGPYWHCGCADLAHHYDSQCSAITERSLIVGEAWRRMK